MRNKGAALAAAPLSLALLLAACGSDDDSADGTTITTTTEAATTTSSASPTEPPASDMAGDSTTTAPDGATPTTAAADGGGGSEAGQPRPDNVEDWASALIRAWGAGDRDRAAELASPDAVDRLFGHSDPGGPAWALRGCEGAAGTIYCSFVDETLGETLSTGQASMPDEGTGQLVPIGIIDFGEPGQQDQADVQAAMGAHSSGLIRAWGTGDRTEATVYAHPEVVDALFDIADPGGPGWDLRDCISEDDDPVCIFYDPGRDDRVLIHFDPTALPGDLVIAQAELREGASG